MNAKESEKAQEKYVEAVVEGKTKAEAAILAGYSPSTPPQQIDANPRVKSLMVQALEKKGLNEDWLADKLNEGAVAALTVGAKEKDINGLAQITRQVAFLLGYGKKEPPTVAVQINNSGDGARSDGAIPKATPELVERVEGLLARVEAQLGLVEPALLPEGALGPRDPKTHRRMARPAASEEAAGGGGQP